jgi:hypothetical protein
MVRTRKEGGTSLPGLSGGKRPAGLGKSVSSSKKKKGKKNTPKQKLFAKQTRESSPITDPMQADPPEPANGEEEEKEKDENDDVFEVEEEEEETDLANARAALPDPSYKLFEALFKGVLSEANKNAATIATKQMELIQNQNDKAAERQRKLEAATQRRIHDDAERFTDNQRILTEEAAERQRKHEVRMAELYNLKGKEQEERQHSLFEGMLQKNAKSFSNALAKEGDK